MVCLSYYGGRMKSDRERFFDTYTQYRPATAQDIVVGNKILIISSLPAELMPDVNPITLGKEAEVVMEGVTILFEVGEERDPMLSSLRQVEGTEPDTRIYAILK